MSSASILDLYRNFPKINQSPLQSEQSTEDLQRFARYAGMYSLYVGDHWEKPREDGDEYVTANFSAKFVDKSASFLMGKGWTIIDPDSGYAETTIPFLNEVWEDNQRDVLCFEHAQTGGIAGDAFWLVTRTEDFRVSITNFPPVFVTPRFHPTDRSKLLSGRLQFPMIGDINGQIRTMTIMVDAEKLTYYIDGQYMTTVYHNLGECPLVHVRNRVVSSSLYGASDLAHIESLQKNLNRKLTDLSDIVDYFASPSTLAYGVRLSQFQKGAKKMYAGLPADSRIENLELKSDLSAATNYVQYLVQLMHILSDIPQIALSDDKNLRLSNTSGLAIQLMFQTLLDITQLKRGTYGYGLKTVNRLALKYGVQMGIISAPTDPLELKNFYKTDVRFNDPLPRDELIQLNKIITRLKNGLITVKDALEALGETNVSDYIEDILEDIAEGRNLVASSGGSSNIGGIVRDQATVEQVQASVDTEIEKNSVEDSLDD